MIQTSAVGFDGRAELVSRLEFLREVEIPRLQTVQRDGDDAGIAALTYARREVQDIVRLLDQLAAANNRSLRVVRPNACVTVHDQEANVTEEMIVHDADLTIRAPGFISVDSPLGRAVIDRRVGDVVEVQAPGGSRRYVIRGIGRDCTTAAFTGGRDYPPGMRVILAVEGSDHSLKAAELLAGILPKGSNVRLVGVVGYEFNTETHHGPVGEAQERLSHAPKPGVSIFDAPARLCREAGAEVSDVHRYGHPAQEILSEAEEWQANMIVVGHHDGPARWFFGSVAEALVKNSSVPILIVPSC